MGSPDRGDAKFYRLGFLMLGVVSSYALLICGGAMLGQALDRRMGTDPWFLVGGFLLGALACVVETLVARMIWDKT